MAAIKAELTLKEVQEYLTRKPKTCKKVNNSKNPFFYEVVVAGMDITENEN